jgi:hypothetical protein
MKRGTNDYFFAWNWIPPVRGIRIPALFSSRIRAGQIAAIVEYRGTHVKWCSTILVVSGHLGPGQQQIAEALQRRRLGLPYGRDTL